MRVEVDEKNVLAIESSERNSIRKSKFYSSRQPSPRAATRSSTSATT